MIYNLDSLIAEAEKWHETPGVFISREDVRLMLVILNHVKLELARHDAAQSDATKEK